MGKVTPQKGSASKRVSLETITDKRTEEENYQSTESKRGLDGKLPKKSSGKKEEEKTTALNKSAQAKCTTAKSGTPSK